MSALTITAKLRTEIQRFYRLREPVCNADVRAEYRMLVRKGAAGIIGDGRLEALRDVFVRNGADPVVWKGR